MTSLSSQGLCNCGAEDQHRFRSPFCPPQALMPLLQDGPAHPQVCVTSCWRSHLDHGVVETPAYSLSLLWVFPRSWAGLWDRGTDAELFCFYSTSWWLSTLVSQRCCKTVPHSGWLKQQTLTVSQFWRLGMWNQGVSWAGSFWGLGGRSFPTPAVQLLGLCWPSLAFLGWWQHHSRLCVAFSLCVWISPFYNKDTSPTEWDPSSSSMISL